MLGEHAVLTPLAGPALLVTALAPDARLLRRTLDEALAAALRDMPTAQRNTQYRLSVR